MGINQQGDSGTDSIDGKPDAPAAGLDRRSFLRRISGVVFAAGLGDQIGGGSTADKIFKIIDGALGAKDEDGVAMEIGPDFLSLEMEEKAVAYAESLQQNHPEMTEHDRAMRTLDYLGMLLFGYGVGSLLSGGHIHSVHYAALTALLGAKMQLSTLEEQHHLVAELKSSAKAGLIIGATVTMAEGVKVDLTHAFDRLANHQMENQDRVALLALLAGISSPLITTVGAATLSKKVAAELVGENKDLAAVLMQYISNSSGFVLFGDPPFIALCEKYGFSEAVSWQFKSMLPLGLYSLVSSAFKANFLLAESTCSSRAEAVQQAWKDTVVGMRRNLPVLVQMMKISLHNFAKYFSGADLLLRDTAQNPAGLMFEIESVLVEKLEGALKLFQGQVLSTNHHEDTEGLPSSSLEEIKARAYVTGVLDGVQPSLLEDSEDQETVENKRSKLVVAIQDLDFEQLEKLGYSQELLGRLKNIVEAQLQQNSPQDPNEAAKSPLTKLFGVFNMITDLNNIKGAVGHNLGDIIDVFPFQAGCVPFLTTGFKDLRQTLDGLLNGAQFEAFFSKNPALKGMASEAVIFTLLMMFSSIADNYVACKVGLELYPTKPEIALVPSVIGGGLSSVGNMANLALFNLNQLPLDESFKKMGWHVDIAAFGFLWAQLLPLVQKAPFLQVLFGKGIQPNAAKGSVH